MTQDLAALRVERLTNRLIATEQLEELLTLLNAPCEGRADAEFQLKQLGPALARRVIAAEKAEAALKARINAAKEEGWVMGLREAAEIAQNRHEAWTDDSGVSCDVTACADIAVAILAKIKEAE